MRNADRQTHISQGRGGFKKNVDRAAIGAAALSVLIAPVLPLLSFNIEQLPDKLSVYCFDAALFFSAKAESKNASLSFGLFPRADSGNIEIR